MPIRSSRVIDNYLKYRLLSNGNRPRIDHGVLGGMVFYDRTIKNYLTEYDNEKKHNPNISLVEFFEKGNRGTMRFSLNQLIVFMYVADCIINHNIWKANPNREELYRQYKLDSLIGDKFKRISFNENPLLFILVMSDTLEPYKNFYSFYHSEGRIDDVDYNVDDVFSAYSDFGIHFSNNSIHIRISNDLKDECRRKLYDMEDWIAIQVFEEEQGFMITVL